MIQAAGFLNAVAGGRPKPFNFRPDLRIETLIETVHTSSRVGAWREVRKSFDLWRGSVQTSARYGAPALYRLIVR